MNPLPFYSTDAVFVGQFETGLSFLLQWVIATIAAPLSALLVVWIIVQGLLVMRGDLDVRRGVTQIVKVVLVYGLVSGASLYTQFVQEWFLDTLPTWIANLAQLNNDFVPTSIPLKLDEMLALLQAELEGIAAQVPAGNNIDSSSVQMAKLTLYGTLWTVFALYEATNLVSSVLVALGPIFIIGYLFDATKPIAERWVGQLIYYAFLLLLINIVSAIVLQAELVYVTVELALITVLTPVAGQINDIWDLDIFLLTGDFLILSMPAAAAVISGGYGASRGETSVGSLGGGSPGGGGFGGRLASPVAQQLSATQRN